MRRFALQSRTALAARPRVASARSGVIERSLLRCASTTTPAAALRIIHVTDVYTLDNFPHLKTLIVEMTKAAMGDPKVQEWAEAKEKVAEAQAA